MVQPNSILYPPPIGPAVFKLEHPAKVLYPRSIALLGIVIEVRLEQLSKA